MTTPTHTHNSAKYTHLQSVEQNLETQAREQHNSSKCNLNGGDKRENSKNSNKNSELRNSEHKILE